MKKNLLRVTVMFLCAVILMLPLGVYAAKDTTITKSINLAMTNDNLRGAGYEWQNLDDTLVLSGIRLVTDDAFGIKFHSDVTVKLTGDNYISAKDYALHCLGSITFEGTGTLTLVSGDSAIHLSASEAMTDTIRFRGGSYDIRGGSYGIYSDTATVSCSGANIKAEGSKGAIRAKNVTLSGGSVKATGGIHALADLTVAFTGVEAVSTSGPALYAGKKLDIQAKRITAGETLNGLMEIESYGSEKAVKITANSAKGTRSTLFGEKFPAFVDYLAFIFLILAIAALVGIPMFIKYKKTQKLIALNEEMNRQAKTKKKAKK